MARILLINPPIYDFAAFDLWARPLGLLYVAGSLERSGHEVRVVDCLDRLHPAVRDVAGKYGPKRRPYGTGSYFWREAETPPCYAGIPRLYKRFGLPEEVVRRELAEGPRPDVVGVTSGMTYWYIGAAEAVRLAREEFPDAPTVLGGIYATLCPEHARETVRPDYVVEGPGESAMARIISEITGEAGGTVGEDLATAANPAYHLLAHVESVSVLTGRGCPYSCAYCASRILAPELRRREAQAVVEEIEGYKTRLGVRDVAFHDDALLYDAEAHIKPILREVLRRKLGLRFHTPNGLHARMMDEELARLMKEAGFVTIRLSLETAERTRLGDWDNKVSYGEFLSAVDHLKQAGYEGGAIGAYVMTGIPGETALEAARSIAAAHAAGVKVKLAQYSPIPGTAYFERARREARVDITEPLMQNNTVMAAGGVGPYEKYETLKRFARRLNDQMERGRAVFTRAQVESGFEKALGAAGIEI